MTAGAVAAPDRPYKGLRPFEATPLDALFFFGRDRERQLITANLMAARLTVLYGESGVGKSSVLRAGVVQTLRGQAREGAGFVVALYSDWSAPAPVDGIVEAVRAAVADVVGTDPGAGSGTLAERLARLSDFVGGEVYLVLDQVDEYFLYHPSEPGPLLDALPPIVTDATLRVNVLLGIREESLARLDVLRPQIPGLFANALRLERLDRDAGRAAIVGPLERWRELTGGDAVEIEPAVVDAILASVAVTGAGGNGNGAGPAAIEPPYLQVVMERLWDAERAAGSTLLRLSMLEALGGGRRIVAEHLDRALAGLDTAEQDAAAKMFAHLVTPSGAKMAFDVADLAGYAAVDEPETQHVVDALVDERILRTVGGGDGARVEIFHDVLAAAAAEWRRRHEAARALETERAEARRRHRRLLVVAIAAVVALALMTAVAVFAVAQQREANDQRAAAAAEARAAQGRAATADAARALPTNPAEALRLAALGASVDPSPRTEDALRTTLVAVSQRALFGTGKAAVLAGAFSPDGKTIAIGDAGGRVVVAPRHGGRRKAVFHHDHRPVNAVAFVGAADLLVTASDDRTAAVWNVTRHRRLHVLRHDGPVTDLAVAGDGTTLATASADGHVRIWSLPGGRLLRTIAFPSRVDDIALDADAGRVLAVGGDHARLYDTSSGALVGTYERFGKVTAAAVSANGQLVVTGHPGKHAVAHVWRADGTFLTALMGFHSRITDVEFAPDSLLLVMASADGDGRVYNLGVRSARQFIAPLIGHTNHVLAATFSPDGTRIVTASSDKNAAVWELEGLNRATLVGHTESVTGAAMSVDDRYVLTWSKDGTARVWDWQPEPLPPAVGRTGGHPQRAVFGDGGAVVASLDAAGVARVNRVGSATVVRIRRAAPATALAISRDGALVATGGSDGRVLVSRASGGAVSTLVLGRPVRAVAFSADGRRLAGAGRQGRVRIWTPVGGLIRTLETGRHTVTAVALSPDAGRIAVGDGKGLITIWNTSTGAREHTLTGHSNDVLALAFSADGRLLVSGSKDADARIWRVSDGHTVHLLRRHFSRVTDVEFSPDGRWVVSTGQQRVVLWRTATGVKVVLLQWSPPHAFVAAGFRANSRTIVTAGADGAVRAYMCSVCGRIGELRRLAELRLRKLRPLGG